MPLDKAAKNTATSRARSPPSRDGDSSVCDNCKSSAALQAPAKAAASTRADEARPAAVGNEIAAVDLSEKDNWLLRVQAPKKRRFSSLQPHSAVCHPGKNGLDIFL